LQRDLSKNNKLSFAMGNGGTLPAEKGKKYDCKVSMRRLGPWLITNDDSNCGRLHVTFDGNLRAQSVMRWKEANRQAD
jgi:hypothetical protein